MKKMMKSVLALVLAGVMSLQGGAAIFADADVAQDAAVAEVEEAVEEASEEETIGIESSSEPVFEINEVEAYTGDEEVDEVSYPKIGIWEVSIEKYVQIEFDEDAAYPDVMVRNKQTRKVLRQGSDYSIAGYLNNDSEGEAYVILKCLKGTYAGKYHYEKFYVTLWQPEEEEPAYARFKDETVYKRVGAQPFDNPVIYDLERLGYEDEDVSFYPLSMVYKSSDEYVATVEEDTGLVTIHGEGSTCIEVYILDFDFECTIAYTLIVEPALPSVRYQAKVVGESKWQGAVRDGKEAGTTGKSLIMEALKINIVDPETGELFDTSMLGVEYCGHVQNVGWEKWVSNGDTAGRPGKNLRIEALKLRLTGELKDNYDIYYCLHCQNYGWLGWAKNGTASGTAGMSLRVEAIRVFIQEKGEDAPLRIGNYSQTFMYSPSIYYTSYVQGQGWQNEVRKGELSGTSGKSLRLEGFCIRISGEENLGVEYKGHVQNYGWETIWWPDGCISGFPGVNCRIEALQLRLTGADKDKYDIYYCLHVQNFGWLAWAKNGDPAGSSGVSMRVEAYVIKILPKGSPKPKNYGSRTNAFVNGVGATKMTLNKTTAKVAGTKR